VLGHPILKGMLPLYLTNVSITKQNHEVVENLKEGLTSHLISQRQSKLMMAKNIVYTLASSQSLSNGQGIVKVLGVNM
jgi:hypothetical protein